MDTNEIMRSAESFSEFDPNMSLLTMLTFLFVAQRGEVNQRDLQDYLQVSKSTATRNVAYWSKKRADDQPGLGMMSKRISDHDKRENVVFLTPLGKRFYARLRERHG